VSDDATSPARGASAVRVPGGRRAHRSFASALGLTALNAVVPGTAFLAAGRRKLGAVTLLVFLVLVAGGMWLATDGRRTALRVSVDTGWLFRIAGVIAVVGLL
jgi:polyisoprenyl-teichoic acid--peptidoglycan teichoic acid transferase